MKALVAKINCFAIIEAHIKTLVDASKPTDQVFKIDVVSFYLFPLTIAGVFAYYIIPNESLINVLITSLSVFAALLFNLLMLVLGVIEKRKGTNNFILLQKETYANISYAILISLICVGLLILPYLFQAEQFQNLNGLEKYINIQKVFWFVIYFLLINFGLTMAMILKRMHAILIKLIED